MADNNSTSNEDQPERQRKSADGKGNGTFNPVIFSRKETFNGPANETAYRREESQDESTPALASVVQQTDRNGVQSPNSPSSNRQHGSVVPTSSVPARSSAPSQSFWDMICCCLPPRSGGTDPAHQNSGRQKPSLLGPLSEQDKGKKCLVLDLDETLVHSSFKPTTNPDYIIPVEIEGQIHRVYVCKRPGVDEFLRRMGEFFEIVVYTASLSKYANPLLDQLDPTQVIRHRLFREHCTQYEGSYVKDLSVLDRSLPQTIIIDNSPLSYMFHPQNAIGCMTFIDDMNDRELPIIAKYLEQIQNVPDVRDELHNYPQYLKASMDSGF